MDIFSSSAFWRVLLFCHFVMAVSLLAAVTLQAVAVLMPARQPAGNFIERVRPMPASTVAVAIIILYVPTFLLGAWVYIKYRTYVRIPMEQFGHWWTVGSFEVKEHIVSMGMALLPAYWYFWREPLSADFARERKWLTLFLAFAVWYAFLVGHTANDFRGVGS
jgi:type IV secretory pathway VirB2 component (pilin)